MQKNQLKISAKNLATAQDALDKLLKQKSRCEDATNSGAGYADQISNLQRRRSELEAQAFLDGTAADVAAINTQITDAEQQAANAFKTAAAAHVAADLLVPQIESAQEVINERHAEHKTAIAEALQTTFQQAEDEYSQAAMALKLALAKMSASAQLLKQLTGYGPVVHPTYIVNALRGEFAGMGLITKSNITGQYQADGEINIDRLSSHITKADGILRSELVASGAVL